MIAAPDVLAGLERVVDRACEHMPAADRDTLLAEAAGALPEVEESPRLAFPAERLAKLEARVETRYGGPARRAFAAALIARLALRLADRLPSKPPPASVMALYPDAFARLGAWLRDGDLSAYGSQDELFLKDLRIVGGYSVPCGAQDVDLYSTITPWSGLKSIVTQGDVRGGWASVRDSGPPWFAIHTDPRNLGEFNESGWERCYVRITELLERSPEVKGMVGTSWFYDPQIVGISPRLAYLQTTPLANGAYRVRHGPGAIHTQRATATSPTRRALVESGSYRPVCYSIVWRRDELRRWRDRR